MSELKSPEISVVIVTPDDFATIDNTMKCLTNQTVKDKMEVVIVVPFADRINPDNSEPVDFRRVKVVEVGAVKSLAWGNAQGACHATAPVIVFAEDHSYPDPDWAEALIRAHKQQWAAVGPVIRNANPGSALSWADLLMTYGPWLDPAPAEMVGHLPGYNCSYKRSILMEYDRELESMLREEIFLHQDLRSNGFQIYLEPNAKVSHVNLSLPSSWMEMRFLTGRVFAAARSKNWSALKRAVYILGAPLIPVIRIRRIIFEAYKPGRLQNMDFSMKIRVLIAIIFGSVLDGLGQLTGFARGAGRSEEKLSTYEFHRHSHLTAKERRANTLEGRHF